MDSVGEPEATSPEAFLAIYVERHNDGVRSGDFSSLLDLLAPDAEMVFVGIPFGPLRGRDAIARAFAMAPPDQEIWIETPPPGAGSARYGWRSQPGVTEGEIAVGVETATGRIRRVVVHGGPSRKERELEACRAVYGGGRAPAARPSRRGPIVGTVIGFCATAWVVVPIVTETVERIRYQRGGGKGELADWGEPLFYALIYLGSCSMPMGVVGAAIGWFLSRRRGTRSL